ncbi:MAG: zinc dependent phospholipase C family protein [Chloroflexi bacterium]|nr:zinc dependent phospholipase C family protein [Chloroflexota bacterium]MCY4111917.1 zinc dependent phospholipase C family protein [Chloroflexota bacterium]
MALSRAHLQLAVEAVDRMGGPLRRVIDAHFSNFCVGAVAPDARDRTATGRAATHFFEFREPSTWGRATAELFAARSALARPDHVADEQAAYVAGYLAHLAVDEVFVLFCGEYARRADRAATVGLTYALERGWDDPSGALARAAGSVHPFDPGGIDLIVAAEPLSKLTRWVHLLALATSPAEIVRVFDRADGRPDDPAEAERIAAERVSTGRELFGNDVAERFAALAADEIDRRLTAYERGDGARYDSPSLRAGFETAPPAASGDARA